jgi:CheY-like chemotaxis protein
VCQLHGGDVGVSSKDGEGSTFGFFFKVRRSDGTSSNSGRPPFGTNRTTSDSANPATQAQNIKRPSYKRATSTLESIKEYKERAKDRAAALERESHGGVDSEEVPSKLETPTSHIDFNPEKRKPEDKDSDDMNPSINNPPTALHDASHPKANTDERTCQTSQIAEQVQQEQTTLASSLNPHLPDLTSGETARQKDIAESVSKLHSDRHAKDHDTILLVEDNLINQKVLRRQLQSRGFEVFVANNGQEAVDMVEARGVVKEANSKRRNYFDCILMDQEMPVMDGNTATEEIRELQKQGRAGHCPILGVSANVREAQTNSMIESGMDAVISKPFKVDDLVKKIRGLLLSSTPISKDKVRKTMDEKAEAEAQLPKSEIQIPEPEIQRPRPKSEQENVDAVRKPDGFDQEKPVVKEKKLATAQAKQRTNQGEPETRHENEMTRHQQSEIQSDTPKTQQLYKESKQDMDESRREAGKSQHSPTRSKEQSDDR